ncbi:hypothetical protein [Thalassotalea agarivorans]|uniref:Uncharacterized protein n=1 Tax=Thalassotalea agarivorans TaxID=349064 RepID=A0A1H9Y678_THASX|nr:hypothetical protein [Thalassotalea agarivorans]SES64403.1 hypothetical protein SAMN05660429_00095 [Thalassotalea agarivorans]
MKAKKLEFWHYLLLAMLLHGALFVWLLLSPHTAITPSNTAVTPIESYLYQPPEIPEPNIESPKPVKEETIVTKEIHQQVSTTAPQIETNEEQLPAVTSEDVATADVNEDAVTVPRFDAINALQSLKKKQAVAPEYGSVNTNQNASVFNPQPQSVSPSLGTPLTDREKQEQRTTHYGAVGQKIIKGDDGRCSLVQDLSFVGMEGITAVQSFACGETKMERDFRMHMQQYKKKSQLLTDD